VWIKTVNDQAGNLDNYPYDGVEKIWERLFFTGKQYFKGPGLG
jgi:hypothetical protein